MFTHDAFALKYLYSASVLYLLHLQFHCMRFESVSYKQPFVSFRLAYNTHIRRASGTKSGRQALYNFHLNILYAFDVIKFSPTVFILFFIAAFLSSQSYCLPCSHSCGLAFVVLATFTMLIVLGWKMYGTVWTTNYISLKTTRMAKEKYYERSESHSIQAEYIAKRRNSISFFGIQNML